MFQGKTEALKDLLVTKRQLKCELVLKEKDLQDMIDSMDPRGPCLIREITSLKDRISYINDLINTVEAEVAHG